MAKQTNRKTYLQRLAKDEAAENVLKAQHAKLKSAEGILKAKSELSQTKLALEQAKSADPYDPGRIYELSKQIKIIDHKLQVLTDTDAELFNDVEI